MRPVAPETLNHTAEVVAPASSVQAAFAAKFNSTKGYKVNGMTSNLLQVGRSYRPYAAFAAIGILLWPLLLLLLIKRDEVFTINVTSEGADRTKIEILAFPHEAAATINEVIRQFPAVPEDADSTDAQHVSSPPLD